MLASGGMSGALRDLKRGGRKGGGGGCDIRTYKDDGTGGMETLYYTNGLNKAGFKVHNIHRKW